MKHLTIIGICLLILSSNTLAEERFFKPGKWETSIRIEIKRALFPIPFKTNKCFTKIDRIPNTVRDGQDCIISNNKNEGDITTWHLSCSDDKGTIEGDGKVEFKEGFLEGNMVMKIIDENGKELPTMQYIMRGVRKGNCD